MTYAVALIFDEFQHFDTAIEVVSYPMYGDPYCSSMRNLIPVIHNRVECVSSVRSVFIKVFFQLIPPGRIERPRNFNESLGIRV